MTKIVLRKPIQFGQETISELEIRDPKAKDFRKFPMQPAMGDILDLAGHLAGQPKQVIDELGVQDMMEVFEIVGAFFPFGLETGIEPSPS
jgi:hypothetical protein